MRERRLAIIAGGANSLGGAIAKALADQGVEPVAAVEIKREETPPDFDPRLYREPRRKDWKQRERRRPRR
jgi:NAD(P)-dependent dehydrogenase (short-subunit alcohol dehydrogenase family)